MIDQVGAIHAQWLEVIQTAIVFTVLTTIAVGLRFWTKSTTKAGFGSDDVFIGIALFLFYGLVGVQIYGRQLPYEYRHETDDAQLVSMERI